MKIISRITEDSSIKPDLPLKDLQIIVQKYLSNWNYLNEIDWISGSTNTIDDFILLNWLLSEIDIFSLYKEYKSEVLISIF